MKVKYLEECKDYLGHCGITDLSSPAAYSIMIDYAYSHRVECDPDEFVAEMRRWHRNSMQAPPGSDRVEP